VEQAQLEFLTEIEDRVEQLFVDIDELRANFAAGPARRNLVDRIFRHVHSVKGAAASIEFMDLSEIAHEFEDLLGSIRTGNISLDQKMLEAFDESAQALLDSLNASRDEHGVSSSSLAPAPKPAPTISSETRSTTEQILNALPFELWQSLGPAEKQKLIGAINEGGRLFIIATSFAIAEFEDQFRQVKDYLEQRGEVVSTSPTTAADRPDRINFRILFAAQLHFSTLNRELERFPDVTVTELAGRSQDTAPIRPSQEPAPSLIRVNLNDLDRVISSTHSLFRKTIRVLEEEPEEKTAQGNRQGAAATIRQSFMALEQEIIQLRMITLERTLLRAMRAGRSAARAAGKQVETEIVGGELRLDRLLCNAIADPLIHLVRNAVDHGIEMPEERLSLGKPAKGHIRIVAEAEGARTRLRVVDDGRGIDPIVIANSAARLGIVDLETMVDLEKSLRLIFRPGFSTADEVSTTSGRGVGLDVVESTVEQAGGQVLVSSRPGEGTIFEIRLPVSFGVLGSQVVMSDGNYYCIDAGRIVGRLSKSHDQLSTEGTFVFENEALKAVTLRELLGQPAADSEQTIQLVVCDIPGANNTEHKRLGLVVDSILDVQEVLVRNLGRRGGRWYGVAGAAELQDDRVALVLDLSRLLGESPFESAVGQLSDAL